MLLALLRKLHEAKLNKNKRVIPWGTGAPEQEFCHAGDCANACVFHIQNCAGKEITNIGVGKDIFTPKFSHAGR